MKRSRSALVSSVFCSFWIVILSAGPARSARATIKVPLPDGFELQQLLKSRSLRSFTWDERGSLWTLSGKGNRLVVNSYLLDGNGSPTLSNSFSRLGRHPASILVDGSSIIVSDGGAIRIFQQTTGARFTEKSPLPLPQNIFPKGAHISSLRWSPLGHIYFSFHSEITPEEGGIGRLDYRKAHWEILAQGIDGRNLAFDGNGFPIASDASSDLLFRVSPGLDYAKGLENQRKADLALRVDRPGVKPTGIAVYTGALWPDQNKSTWLLFDKQTFQLQQYQEDGTGLKHQRDLPRWQRGIDVSELQIGPDGALWLLETESLDSRTGGEKNHAIMRLVLREKNQHQSVADLGKLSTPDLVAQLKNSNSWHRDTALRVLESRNDLRNVRGLHPTSDLHKLFRDKNSDPMCRVYALWALHRLALLEDDTLEDASDDAAPEVRVWAARLMGERRYPTRVAFSKLVKMARDTNSTVRASVAIAARQFVSGSFLEMTPPVIPIREVFTGGILSSLWFSTESGSKPEFDLLFWNAVKPITAFDAAHPLGFFNGDREEKLALAYWLITPIARQIAETKNALQQQDAMLMISELKPANHRMILCALRGLQEGSARRKVVPPEKSLKVLAEFAKNANHTIASLAGEIFQAWNSPIPEIRSPR